MREDDDVQELRRGLVVLEERAKLENEVFENGQHFIDISDALMPYFLQLSC